MKIGNGDNTDSRIYTAADLRRRGPKFFAAFGAPIEFFGGGGTGLCFETPTTSKPATCWSRSSTIGWTVLLLLLHFPGLEA